MLSFLAVIVVGGVILAGTFETGTHATSDAELAQEREPEDKPDDAPKKEEQTAVWGAASFEDMLGDEEADDQDNGFASSAPSELGDEADIGGFEPRAREEGGPNFSRSSRTGRSQAKRPAKRVVADAAGGISTPISVDASLVSPEVGGKGQGDASEID